MSDTEAKTDDGRVTRRMLAAGEIERVLSPEKTGLIPMNTGMGGLNFQNAFQLAEAAKLMSTAGPILPPWLQGNVGGCWAVLLRSQETGISALALAAMMYVTEKNGVQRVGYDSVFFRTMVEKFAPIKERLAVRYEGEGDDLVCIVSATFKGEHEPRQFPVKGTEKEFTLKKLHPGHNTKVINGETVKFVRGSPLWDDKPPLQMFYAMSRDWARMFAADVVAGAYSREELISAGYSEVVEVKQIAASPNLRERLSGPTGVTDLTADLDLAIKSARVDDKKPGRAVSAGAAGGDAPADAAPSSNAAPSQGDGAVDPTDQQQEPTS